MKGKSYALILRQIVDGLIQGLGSLLLFQLDARMIHIRRTSLYLWAIQADKGLEKGHSLFAFPLSNLLQRLGDGNSVNPGGQAGISSEIGRRTIYLDKDLLCEIFSVMPVGQKAQTSIQHSFLVLIDQYLEGRLTSSFELRYQGLFVQIRSVSDF